MLRRKCLRSSQNEHCIIRRVETFCFSVIRFKPILGVRLGFISTFLSAVFQWSRLV